MKIRIKGNGGKIVELTRQDFFHLVLLKTVGSSTDYSNEELFEIRNKLQENNYEYTLDHYEDFIEEFGLDKLAELIDVEIKEY